MTEAEQRIHDCLDSREGERGWVTLMAPDVRALLADRDEREAKLRAERDALALENSLAWHYQAVHRREFFALGVRTEIPRHRGAVLATRITVRTAGDAGTQRGGSMSDLIKRLRDKTRLRAVHGLSGWVLSEEALLSEAADEIERLRADLEREQLRLAACGVVALANTPESAAKARQMHDDYRSASCDGVARAVDREMALRAALVAAMEIVQKERTRIAYNAKGAPPAIYDGYADIMRRLDAVIAQADAALGAER